ncbi:MAG: response regulator [Chloroflexi bacterium]|nr:response regulator [Chloroflexota bacterium]
MAQTILVVDDEPQIVKVLRGYLEQARFRVVTANDGQLALTQYKHEKPDLRAKAVDGPPFHPAQSPAHRATPRQSNRQRHPPYARERGDRSGVH